jgi:hypothetical protein
MQNENKSLNDTNDDNAAAVVVVGIAADTDAPANRPYSTHRREETRNQSSIMNSLSSQSPVATTVS